MSDPMDKVTGNKYVKIAVEDVLDLVEGKAKGKAADRITDLIHTVVKTSLAHSQELMGAGEDPT